MENDNTIKKFTAADIEKYHKGLLSPVDMNALEKAALDDPFLADAIEGYTVAGVDSAADIADLQKRLEEKVDGAKVITMQAGNKSSSFRWLRIAAAVVVFGGLAALANQLFLKPEKSDIAQTTETAEPPKSEPKTISKPDSVIKPGNTKTNSITTTEVKESQVTVPAPVISNGEQTTGAAKQPGKLDVPVVTETVTNPAVTERKETEDTWKKITAATDEKKEIFKKEAKSKAPGTPVAQNDVVLKDQSDKGITGKNAAMAKKVMEQYKNNQVSSLFRGRITDANNIGLPFARVYNPADKNAGTYTDANGYFNLTYPDTVLNIQVKALGFENTNAQLRTSFVSNRVVMQDDRSLNAVIINNQKTNTNFRSFNTDKNKTLEEPEPADGWDNYDTYIANNLNMPEEEKYRQKSAGYVQVSFEVDKNGEPVNITVEKSLCPKCDAEAIRLIKEGPKWRRSAKKHGKTSVIINF